VINSFHPGGLNVLLTDGSVRFVLRTSRSTHCDNSAFAMMAWLSRVSDPSPGALLTSREPWANGSPSCHALAIHLLQGVDDEIRPSTRCCRPSPLISACLWLGSSLLVGCGGPSPHSNKPIAEVTIAVTYGGAPVTEGRVDLNNEQAGEAGGGELDSKGVAKIPGMVLGNYTVTVVPLQPRSRPRRPASPPRLAKSTPISLPRSA